LFGMTIDRSPMPMPLTTDVRIELDIDNATAFAGNTYMGFDFGQDNGGQPDLADRAELRALIAQAEQAISSGNYTQLSVDVLAVALASAQIVYGDTDATQTSIDIARLELLQAYNALVERPATPPVPPTEGQFYLVNISARTSTDITRLSSMDDFFHPRAVVEMREDGNRVHFFQTANLGLASDYTYDQTQSDNNASARANLIPAMRHDRNAAGNAEVVTVEWSNTARTLMVGMHITPPGFAPMTQDARMMLDLSTSTRLTGSTYMGFDFIVDPGEQPPTPVDRTALRALIARAGSLNAADYTEQSFGPFNAALTYARTVYNNANATQPAVNGAQIALQQAYDALVLRPVAPPQPPIEEGRFYLVNISARESGDTTRLSSMDPFFHPRAVVEVREDGDRVHFFQTANLGLASDYTYDKTQSNDNASARESLVPSLRHEGNVVGNAEVITVEWSDISRTLMVGMFIAPPGPGLQDARMMLDLSTSTRLTDSTYMGFDFTVDTDIPVPPPAPANKAALRALIALAENVNQANFTAQSLEPFNAALTHARNVYNNANATQSAVNAAHDDLRQAYDALVRRPTTPPPAAPDEGQFYLMNISVRRSDNTHLLSSMDDYFHTRAVVEVRGNSHLVHFFQTENLGIASNYTFDRTQSDNNATARANIVPAHRHVRNAAGNAEVITVSWRDTARTLMVGIDIAPPGMAPMTQDARMMLDPTTAVRLTTPTYRGFSFSAPTAIAPPAEQGTVNRTALGQLINRAERVNHANYTELSVAALTESLANARSVYNNRNASQAAVNRAYGELRQAFDGLVSRPTGADTVDVNEMTDGRYTVRVDFWHATNNAPSMANGALNNRAIVDVRGDRLTMSVATNPLQVGNIVTNLGTLNVNGGNASVLARNLPGGKPSAFSFNLPNRSSWQPVRLWMSPEVAVMPNAGQNLPARLRISWDTLQRVDGAQLSGSTAVVVAEMPDLDDVERSAEATEAVAPEPILGVNEAFAADGDAADAETRGLSAIDEMLHELATLPWWAWAGIGLGIIGIVGAGWLLYTKKIVPRRSASGVSGSK
ncbi:MAG: hypothetical protein FWC86_04175, partial [Coriobacteriia bacterium]|nr:hypothetical protein [Coriobacteriia bacterium]